MRLSVYDEDNDGSHDLIGALQSSLAQLMEVGLEVGLEAGLEVGLEVGLVVGLEVGMGLELGVGLELEGRTVGNNPYNSC